MIAKLKALFEKQRPLIMYLFFGGLTTLVNFAVYWPLYHLTQLSAAASNMIAWVVAVLFAFFTNKPFVFKSNNWTWRVLLPEFFKFVGCRVISGVFETLFLGLTVDLLSWHGLLMKIIVSVAVVILNYIASKWLIFKKK